jgi:hypothetical protein
LFPLTKKINNKLILNGNILLSVADPLNFYAAPAPCENFKAAWAQTSPAEASTQLEYNASEKIYVRMRVFFLDTTVNENN